MIGTWSFLLGLILAILTVFVNLGEWTTQGLLVLGILTGLFHAINKEFVSLGVIYLALAATAGALDVLIAIGPFISQIAAAWVGCLGPVVLTAFLFWGGPYLIAKKDDSIAA